MSYYYRVLLNPVQRDQEDLLTSMCFEFGASGVSEDLKFHQKEQNYEPQTIVTSEFAMQVYFEKEIPEPFFDELAANYSQVEAQVFREPNRDWLEEWKKGFKAFPLVGDYWIVPSWLESPEQAKYPLKIDPGMAFGTGTHGTTQIASEFVAELLQEMKSSPSVIDVGTGTGVLAILAEKMGASSIVATEIDPDARRVAKENVDLNGCSQIEVLDEQIDELVEQKDVVIANIIDGILVRIQSDLKGLCLPGGHLILTGILKEREDSFLNKFGLQQESPFEVISRKEKDEWVGFLVRRNQ
ncbi:MAG: hypothetical protein CL677_10145 [Bdellovibrionaceae bacterium]|nr:hypothetical protein [Pseudobdellovibrionaceae bacterium]|tara:strand:+ start:55529 stop:56422 length:894 start_codon:yes stop_codon:yes gene_type:complete